MKIEKFSISNFKGIKETVIEASPQGSGMVVTLIGLNESGKTTVLEAISNFVTEDEETSSLVQTVQKRQPPDELVPKSKKGIFTGRISIDATLLLDDADVDAAAAALLAHGFHLNKAEFERRISVERRFTFKDGDLCENKPYWAVHARGTKGKGKKQISLTTNTEDGKIIWNAMVAALKIRIPKIVYFPTFLFAFPERIYLRDPPDWDKDSEQTIINRYYRQVLQDVADSIRNPDDPTQRVSIDKQVVQRLEEVKEPSNNPFAFWPYFTTQKEHDKVRAVLNSVADRMGNVVFEAWNKIFDKPTIGKKVQIDFGVDPTRENIPWVEVSIFDGKSTYRLHERSLGFRWFFSFLLFTQFRKSRSNSSGSIFLFDEPASNLHSGAQMRLMESFSNITADGSLVVYSTHSHYLVNPLWLENAYIIRNGAIDYDTDLEVDSAGSTVTDIRAHRYRSFVNENPSRVSYYQPALDALKFNLGPMIPRRRAVIVEGKFDFHPLEYFKRKIVPNGDLDFFPVNGASDADTLIALFRGWGINYVLLLDDDRAGKEAAKRYDRDLGVPKDRLIMLSDASSQLVGKSFEAIYSPEVEALAQPYATRGKVTKRSYFELFVDRCSRGDTSDNLGETEKLAEMVLQLLIKRLDALV